MEKAAPLVARFDEWAPRTSNPLCLGAGAAQFQAEVHG